MAAFAAFLVLAVGALGVGDAAAAPTGGTAEVVAPKDGSVGAGEPLASGSSSTRFSLKLPSGAACSGDSVDGGYRIQSFMVPAAVDPASLTFGPLGPLPKGLGTGFRQPLYAVNTTPFANAATNLADESGGRGVVINVPSFDFDVFGPADLPVGRYTIGIACTKGPPSTTQLDRYWSTTLDLSTPADPASAPSWSAPVVSRPAASAPVAASPGSAPPTSTTAEIAAADVLIVPATGDPATEDGALGTDQASETVVVDGDRTTRAGESTFGGPPTFAVPALDLASAHLTIRDSTTFSLAVWLALAIALGRTAVLLIRAPHVTQVSVR